MDTFKEEYEKIIKEKEYISQELKDLGENPLIKKYFDLRRRCNLLAAEQKEIYTDIKIDEYKSCNHIWVTALKDYEPYESRTQMYCGCIKCGLDEKVFYLMECNPDYRSLTLDQQIMYDYMQNTNYFVGTNTKVGCNLDLAMAIYKKIKEAHPNISDQLAIKYFEIALDNIRNIEVNSERKKSRAKRLSLSENFNKWR